jgi:hydrogenase nickel incorporation protein HypA/HybF
MHEEALLHDLFRKLDEVARENGSGRIRGLTVWIGGLSHLTEEQLRARFPDAARGTAAEGARLEVQHSTDLTDPRAQGVVLVSVDVDPDDPAPTGLRGAGP